MLRKQDTEEKTLQPYQTMFIIFGVKNFGIKNFEPSELGLPQVATDPYRVEYRQKYFHLYWIPVFGLGKDWFLRKSDDKLYEPLGELKQYLNGLPVNGLGMWHHTVRAFFGLIAFAFMAVFMNISQAASHQTKMSSNRLIVNELPEHTVFVEETNSLLRRVVNLKKDDYLEFRSTQKSKEIKYAKVIERNDSEVKIAILKDDLGTLTEDQLINVFFSNPDTESVTVSINRLKEFICEDCRNKADFKGNALNGKTMYELTSVVTENKMLSTTYP